MSYDEEELLPRTGSLAFFYDADDQPWGFDPADRDGFAVVFVPPDAGTEGRSEGEVFPALRLDPQAESTLPSSGDGGTVHRCLGYPDEIQGDMQLEVQLVTNGLYCGDESGYNDPRADELAKGAAAWRLLLQVDSDEDRGMYWGDVGRIYYWIREEDLRRGAFDATWLVLQCT